MPKTLTRHLSRARPPARSRSLPAGGGSIGSFLAAPTQAGVDITPRTSLTIAAVYAAHNVISGDIASLPCLAYGIDARGSKVPNPDDPLFDLLFWEPNGDMDSYSFTQALFGHAIGLGNGYAGIVRWQGEAVALRLLEPTMVRADRTQRTKSLVYEIEGEGTLPAEDVLHLRAFSRDGVNGLCPIDLARETLGLAKACEISGGSFFGNGAQPNGFLKTSKRLSAEAQAELRENVYREHGGPYQAHRLGILVGDYEWVQTSISPENAQFLATREFSVVEIARWFNINPIKLMDYTNGNYSNVEQSDLDHLRTTLFPWVSRWERELNRKLIARWERPRRLIGLDVTARLRGDSAARVAYYSALFALGALSPNEIRDAESLPRIEGGDSHYIPTNNYTPIGRPADGPTTPGAEGPPGADPPAAEAKADDQAGADVTAAAIAAIVEENEDGY